MRNQDLPRYPRTIRRPSRVEIRIEEGPRRPRRLRISSLPLLLLAGFGIAILIGTVLLMLPISSESGDWTSPVIALFVSTSAVCVTGLVPVDTATHWSGFGEAVIILLIQFGGLGFMTSTTLLFLLFGWRLGLRERLNLSQSMDLSRMGGVVSLARRAILFTLIIETAGVAILFARFVIDQPVDQALWWSVFHSISAFNNAGFDLTGGFQSLQSNADAVTLLTIAALIVFGSIGFLVVGDVMHLNRNTRRLTADSVVVLRATAILLITGFLVFLFLESGNLLAGKNLPDRLLHSFFNSVSHRTAGFTSLPISEAQDETQFFTLGLMFIGGASGSTAGGIKVGTLAVIMSAAFAAMRGREHAELASREMPRSDVDRALAVVLLSALGVFVVAIGLARLQDSVFFLPVLFEATSAFATNGLSASITPTLDDSALLLLTATMYIGRLGPLTLVLALVQRSAARELRRLPEERVRIG